jgi:hypothetical protein
MVIEMFRFIIIQLFVTSCLLFPQQITNQNTPPDDSKYYEGKNGIDLNLGFYDNSNVTSTSIVTVINSSEVSNATGGFTGSISYQYWFKNYLSIRIGIGALVTNVENKTYTEIEPFNNYTGYVKTEVATISSMLTGINFYPLQLSDEKRFLPYISLYAGPYIGVYNKSEVLNTSVREETLVETTLGCRTGAGFSILIGSIFKLGIDFGYNFMGDFDSPIGVEKNYSGPDYSMLFGFVF